MDKNRDLMKDVQAPIEEAPIEVRRIIGRVLEAEKQKLFQARPHLISDVVAIIKEEIQ